MIESTKIKQLCVGMAIKDQIPHNIVGSWIIGLCGIERQHKQKHSCKLLLFCHN